MIDDLLSASVESHDDFSSLVGALLAHQRFSPRSNRGTIQGKIPPVPESEREASSLFRSVVLTYVLARALGPNSHQSSALANYLSAELERHRDRRRSLYADLIQLGALIEVDPSARTREYRTERAYVPGLGEIKHEDRLAAQWFLRMYGSSLSEKSEDRIASGLRSLAETPVESMTASSPEEAVMLLEARLIRRPAYRMVTEQDYQRAVQRRAGWRLWVGGLVTASAFVVLLWYSLGNLLLAASGETITYFALASVAVPGVLSIVHTFISGRRRIWVWTLTVGILYVGTLLVFDHLVGDPDLVSKVSSGAGIAVMIPILFGAFHQDWRALRE